VCEADVRDEPQVRDLVQRMERLDAVVHLVGGFAMGETHTFDVALVREQLELNVVSTFIVLKHALVRMREADYGRIVTVASKSALQPTAQMAAYAAAKAGVLALTRAIADETRGTGITANCVLPSVIDTPANRRAMGEAEAGTWVQPWRLADTIAFLSSEAAGDLRGSALKAYANV
jgi:NAD(P)-dependent dehydrogenase (short-subunit alcohol dehydrogenase family)